MLFDTIIHFKNVGSTMDTARLIMPLLSLPFIVISEKQTNGYGQKQRKWFSPEGGLWFTEAIDVPLTEPVSLFMGIVLINTIRKYAKTAMLKWPNDIYIDNKKVAGILTQISKNRAIIGIGINVENEPPKELANQSTSLKRYVSVKKEDLLNEILQEQEKHWERFINQGFSGFVETYNDYLIFKNKKITIKSKKLITGVAIGVNKKGYLLIENSGKIKKIFSGTIIEF